jgi:hypothetical protein
MYYIRSRILRQSMASDSRIIDSKVGNAHRRYAKNPTARALSGKWPLGKSKSDLKQSSLRRVRSSYLKLASWRAELVAFVTARLSKHPCEGCTRDTDNS